MCILTNCSKRKTTKHTTHPFSAPAEGGHMPFAKGVMFHKVLNKSLREPFTKHTPTNNTHRPITHKTHNTHQPITHKTHNYPFSAPAEGGHMPFAKGVMLLLQKRCKSKMRI
jgi:hypothetical protein